MDRKHKREIFLEYLTEEKHYPFGTADEYFQVPELDKEYTLTLCGDTVIFSNALLVEALSRLTFQHGEFSMKPVHDETGRLVPKEDFRIAAVDCGDEDFSVACMRANLRYGKNQKREDVKSHHYIISFDQRNGQRIDRRQGTGIGREVLRRRIPSPCLHLPGQENML